MAEEKPDWDDPHWQGHTHDWPPPEERTEVLTHCRECGLPWPTVDLVQHEEQVAREAAMAEEAEQSRE
jgi:hypothetical protein